MALPVFPGAGLDRHPATHCRSDETQGSAILGAEVEDFIWNDRVLESENLKQHPETPEEPHLDTARRHIL